MSAELLEAFESAARRAMDRSEQLAAAEYDEPVHPEVARQMHAVGLLDIAVREDCGGLGLDSTAVGEICAAAGRALLPAGQLHELLVVAPLLAGADHPDAVATLAAIARGELGAGGGGTTTGNPLGRAGSRIRIDRARVWLSRDATIAGVVSPDLAVVMSLTTALSVEPVRAIDPGQGLHVISGDVQEGDLLAVVEGGAARWLWQRWRFGLCSHALGCAEEVSRISTAYAKERRQFDRPIGAFQAVSHILADMHAGVTPAVSALARAAILLDSADPRMDDAMTAAVEWLPARARLVCEQAIQVHGGTGFTWEYGLHLHYRRVLAVQAALGGRRHAAAEAGAALLARTEARQGPEVA
jgi:alkylation response protein AidB-like acyl-CoA dehydrogenase